MFRVRPAWEGLSSHFARKFEAFTLLLAERTGFHLLPKRWGVERTFGWLMRCRRLVRDHE